jgi:precorrin-2 dehydrogenase / sirohydrochlorin ferrochelatase
MAGPSENLLYPMFVKIAGARCLVVGGGPIALQKVTQLLACRAQVQVISPNLAPALQKLADEGAITWEARTWQTGDVTGALLIISATDDRAVQEQIANEADQAGVMVNIVDVPELCRFYVPSMVTQGDLKIAVSTNGASPAMARQLRMELEEQFGPVYGRFLEFLRSMRTEACRRFPDSAKHRQEFLEQFFTPDALTCCRTGNQEQMESLIDIWTSSLLA